MDEIVDIKAKIRGCLGEAVDSLIQILRNPKTQSQAKIKAFEALANRAGLPAVSANVSQQVKTQINPEELLEARQGLLQEQHKLEAKINSLQSDLNKKKTLTEEGGIMNALPRPEKQHAKT